MTDDLEPSDPMNVIRESRGVKAEDYDVFSHSAKARKQFQRDLRKVLDGKADVQILAKYRDDGRY